MYLKYKPSLQVVPVRKQKILFLNITETATALTQVSVHPTLGDQGALSRNGTDKSRKNRNSPKITSKASWDKFIHEFV